MFKELILLAILTRASRPLSKTLLTTPCAKLIAHFDGKYRCLKDEYLGKGSSAISYVVTDEKMNYVMKAFDTTERLQNAFTDLNYLEKLPPHPNIVKLIDKKQPRGLLLEILELGSKRNLKYFFAAHPEFFENHENILKLFMGILQGVKHLHTNKAVQIVHTDLKPENIIVNSSSVPKIIDFDLAVNIDSAATARGTPIYSDPYVIEARSTRQRILFTEKQDVYSLGVILFYLTQKRLPFVLPTDKKAGDLRGGLDDILIKIHKKGEYMISEKTPRDVAAIIEGCLVRSPKQRLRLSEVIDMTKEAIENPSLTLLPKDTSFSNTRLDSMDIFYPEKRRKTTLVNISRVQAKGEPKHFRIVLIAVIVAGLLVIGSIVTFFVLKQQGKIGKTTKVKTSSKKRVRKINQSKNVEVSIRVEEN